MDENNMNNPNANNNSGWNGSNDAYGNGFGAQNNYQQPNGFGGQDNGQFNNGFGAQNNDQFNNGFGSQDNGQFNNGFGGQNNGQFNNGFGAQNNQFNNDQFNNGFNNNGFDIPTKKGGKSKFPIIAAVIAIIAIIGGSVFAATKLFAKPEDKLKKAVSESYEDFKARETLLGSITLDDDVVTQILTDGASGSGELKVKSFPEVSEIEGLGIKFDGDLSYKSKNAAVNYILNYNNMDLVTVQAYLDDKNISLYIPELFSESFTLENKNIVEQLSNIPYIGDEFRYMDDFSLNPFMGENLGQVVLNCRDKVLESGHAADKKILDALKYEKNGKRTDASGKSYDSYKVTLPWADAKEIFADLLQDVGKSDEVKAYIKEVVNMMLQMDDSMSYYLSADDIISELDSGIDTAVDYIRQSDIKDIVIIVTPYSDGVMFELHYDIEDGFVEINGNYNKKDDALTMDIELNNGYESINMNYNDSIKTENGVINENENFSLEVDGDKLTFDNTSTYDKSSKAFNGTLNASVEGESIDIKYEGTADSDGKKMNFTLDNLGFYYGSEELCSLSGSVSYGLIEGTPAPISASKDIKVKDIDYDVLMDLYSEAESSPLASQLQSILGDL